MSAPIPPLIPEPFGNDQIDPTYILKTIPDTSATLGRASFSEGFPAETMQPEIAGGVPPFGQDVNGILYMLSAHTFAQQGGQPYLYSAGISTAIGGYGLGALLGMADGSGIWVNLLNGNTSNPDANGASWWPALNYGHQPVPTTGGVITLTNLEARKGTIVISGVLVANLQLVLPNQLRSWLIVNTTTGPFSTTVKTAAGTGVVVPAGGYGSPIEVYGDGTNLYPTFSPAALPISVGPSPNTIVLRDGNGDGVFRYLNTTNPVENFGVVYVPAYDVNADYIRKISIGNFELNLFLQNLSGAVINSQVPQSAVTQHSAAVLSNAALTGVPTAPTAAVGTNTTQIATTAFAFAQAIGNGQAWSDQTLNRALGVVYTNTSGRAIQVAFSGDCRRASAGGGTFQALCDGVQVGKLLAAGSTDMSASCSFLVPPGGNYQVSQSGAHNGYQWAELS